MEDTADLGGVVLSLASIIQILSPDTCISSLIKESKEKPLHLFILDNIYRLRKRLKFPKQYLRWETKHLKDYILKLGGRLDYEVGVLNPLTAAGEDPFFAILAYLEDERLDIGPLKYHRVTSTEFAIILGCTLGRMGYHTNPYYGHTRSQMLRIGTAVACGVVKDLRRPEEQ